MKIKDKWVVHITTHIKSTYGDAMSMSITSSIIVGFNSERLAIAAAERIKCENNSGGKNTSAVVIKVKENVKNIQG